MTLKTFNTEHEQNMKKLAKDMTKLNSIKTSESSNFEKEMQKIQNHGDVLKHEVDKYTCKLVNDLEQRWNISKKMIDEDEALTKKLSQGQSCICVDCSSDTLVHGFSFFFYGSKDMICII
jgi:uncharacterized protein YlxW (UPF0749 family)